MNCLISILVTLDLQELPTKTLGNPSYEMYNPYQIDNVQCLNTSVQKYQHQSRTSFLCELPSSSHLCVALKIKLRHRLPFQSNCVFQAQDQLEIVLFLLILFLPSIAKVWQLGWFLDSTNCKVFKFSVRSSIKL